MKYVHDDLIIITKKKKKKGEARVSGEGVNGIKWFKCNTRKKAFVVGVEGRVKDKI